MWTMDRIQQDVQGWKGYKIGCIAKKILKIQSFKL